MRNEKMGCSEAFWGNKNGAKHLRNVTSNIDFRSNVSGENMIRPGEVQKCSQKQQKLKVISSKN